MYPIESGTTVCVQTVACWFVGTLVSVTDQDFVLIDAAWVADTGRFSEFVKTGVALEVEPYPDGVPVVISRAAVVAVATHPQLLRQIK